ncbi:hypothetical protein [Halocalculus aciditolerans]|uniref:Uncharacterized protein n=1 Tax=Halocalculus aciditolerans TaxID=1383812 RepID=A0A830F607_9EURY|nr:hypothetical protein [Halocalculus aciditolerans]GGL57915.1 hypothetical protein GCM10009039_15120 [Halocalculus aciditolerans]
MAELGNYFDEIADVDSWISIVVIAAAFFAGSVMKNTIERSVDAPDELYGVVIMVGGVFAGGDYQHEIVTGGGLYTLDKAMERFGVKSKVQEAV